MKIVILAAGSGSRLDRPQQGPKALTVLANGQSILELQLSALSAYLSLDDLIVSVGYHFEKVMELFPSLLYCYHPDYASLNTAKSLLKVARKVKEDLLFLNGDLVFHPHALKALLNYRKTSMLVAPCSVGEEEMKYTVDADGYIKNVSKNLQGAQGEAVGMNFISKEDLPLFLFHLEQVKNSDYFEHALQDCLRDGMRMRAITIPRNQACEVDFPEDLEQANRLVLEWS